MKKIHIGSKINLVEVPDNVYELKDFQSFIDYAIDNPIAEFDDSGYDAPKMETFFKSDGIYDIPEGYRVDVKPGKERLPCSDSERASGSKFYDGDLF